VKYNTDDTIEGYKARLIIRGDHQIEAFNYNETFALIVKMINVCCFLVVAVAKG